MPSRPGSNCRCSNRRRYRAHQESGRSPTGVSAKLRRKQRVGDPQHAGGRGDGRRAAGAGIARRHRPSEEREVIGVRSGRWLTLRQAQALLNVPDISTTKGMRDRAIIAVLLGCALRRCEVAALTDGRCLGGFTLEATVAARHANTPELSVW